MKSNARRIVAAAVLVAATTGLVAQPTHAYVAPASQPAQIIPNLSLDLPIGKIQLFDADLKVQPGKDGQPEGFRGTARVKLPAIGPLANLDMPDLVRADVGLDTGASLAALGAPLDPARRYFFLDFGGGLNLSREVTGAAGSAAEIDLSVPAGQRIAVIIDPEQPLIFLQGRINVSYTGDLAVISDVLAARGLDLSVLEGVQIPGVSTIVVSGTLAPGTDKNYIELQAGTGVSAGALGAAVGIQAAPIAVQGGARIDKDGVTVTGVSSSKVIPETGWDGKGKIQLRVPFNGQQAWVDLTGALSVPLAQIRTEGARRIDIDGQAVADAVQQAVTSAGDAAQAVGEGVAGTVKSAADAAGQAVGTAVAGARDVVTGTVGALPGAVDSATGAIGSGWQSVMQQVCKATGRC